MNAYSTDRFLNQTAFVALVTGTPETGLRWKANLAHQGMFHSKVILAGSTMMDEIDPDIWIVDSLDTLRQLRPRTQLPILASVSAQTPQAQIAALDIGADDCVLSNATEDELALRVGRLLRKADRPGSFRPMLVTVEKFETKIAEWDIDAETNIGIANLTVAPEAIDWDVLDHRKVAAIQTTLWSRISRQMSKGAIACRTDIGEFQIATRIGGIKKAEEIAEIAIADIRSAPLSLLISEDKIRVDVTYHVNTWPEPTVRDVIAQNEIVKPREQVLKVSDDVQDDILLLTNPVTLPTNTTSRMHKPSKQVEPEQTESDTSGQITHLDNAPLQKGDGSMLSVLHSRAHQVGVAA